jgi:uncharacterized protein (UPF0332 family)
MFHAARAALEKRGIATGSQRHGTIIGRFGRMFVKHGPLDPALGRALNKALELRREVTTISPRPMPRTFGWRCKTPRRWSTRSMNC